MGRHWKIGCILALNLVLNSFAYWDSATTTDSGMGYSLMPQPRSSFFKWQPVHFSFYHFFVPFLASLDDKRNRFLNCVAGISIDFKTLSTALILNRRTLITAANYLEPYLDRMRDVRVWALGRAGREDTPYRYRVWRWRRLLPRSLSTEHYHGPRGRHVPRHDIAIIHTWDSMYIYKWYPTRYHYAYRAILGEKNTLYLGNKELVYVGSGYINMKHIRENYDIRGSNLEIEDIKNCERYLPKWWGKFVCIVNRHSHAGLQNGGGLFIQGKLTGLGCFEIRYNEERMLVFTDLRYYHDLIMVYGNLSYGEYYEYAYQAWGIITGWTYDSSANTPYIPAQHILKDLYPLGK